jgi:DNA-binding XRE family transcriptional regulator
MKEKQYTIQNYKEELAAELKTQRELKGYSKTKVAKAIEVTTKTIDRIEDPDYDCTIKPITLHRYAQFVEWPFTLKFGNKEV